MSTASGNKAERLFLELADAGAEVRRVRLDQECRGEGGLREEVMSLLAHHDAAGARFLDSTFVRSMASRGVDTALASDTRIGDYTILNVLGQGGMGIVYRARQERPRRIVALKVIRRASASPSLVRRFEHEAEVLGRLQHPGIAQIYEAGQADTGQGMQPYIAMELVQGLALGEYCRKTRLNSRERMALLAQVCDAIHHAHQRGIIHRDLKPSNILVDERGQPKVLDFGVARAADAEMGLTLHTGVGELVGTLPYMSPEQVGGKQDDVDTRTDVYSLGVVLYELLADRLPHNLTGLSIPDAARKVREDEPDRLSSVSRVLRGDVDTIVAKALEKDPTRRYQSAADFAADIRAHLAGEPILAKADSAMYVLRKQLRRYRSAVVGAALSLVALVGFTGWIYKQSLENAALAIKERAANEKSQLLLESVRSTQRVALDSAEAARKSEAAALSELAVSNVERGRLFSRTGNVDQAERLIWKQHARDPSSPYTSWALWEMYSRGPCLASFSSLAKGELRSMSLTPDGRLLATASMERAVRLWRMPWGDPVGEVLLGDASPRVVAFSPDGTRLATLTDWGTIQYWDVADRTEIWCSNCGTPKGAFSISFSVDGRMLSVGLRTGDLMILNTADGSVMMNKRAYTGGVYSAKFSPDGSRIALTGSNGRTSPTVLVWRTWDLSAVGSLGGHEEVPGVASWSPDGRFLATGGTDRSIMMWDVEAGRRLATLLAPNGTIRALQWMRDWSIMSSGWQGVDTWESVGGDPSRWTRAASITARETPLTFGVSADGSIVALGYAAGGISVWETATHPEETRFDGGTGRCAAGISPSGHVVAVGDATGVLRMYDASGAHPTPLAEFQAHKGRIRNVRFQPQGVILATGGSDEMLRLWNMRTGTMLTEWDDYHDASARSLTFSADGRNVLYASTQGQFRIRDVESGRVIHSLSLSPMEAVSIAQSPDQSRIMILNRDKGLWLLNGDGSLIRRIQTAEQPWTLAWSDNGRRIVVTTWSRDILVLDAESGEVDSRLAGHNGLPPDASFMPGHDDLLVSVSHDGSMRLWDVSTGRALATLEPFRGWEGMTVDFPTTPDSVVAATALGGAVLIDLSHYNRHIAGNASFQLERLPDAPGREGASELLDWARKVRDNAEAAPPPRSVMGVDPRAIMEWGRSRRSSVPVGGADSPR